MITIESYLDQSDVISKDRATQSPTPGRRCQLPDDGSTPDSACALGDYEGNALEIDK